MKQSLKEYLPDQVTLKLRVAEALSAGMSEFIERTARQRGRVITMRSVVCPLMAVCVLATLGLVVAYTRFSDTAFNLMLASVLLLVIVTVVAVTRLDRQNRLLTQEVNLALMPTVIAVLKRIILFTNNSENSEHTAQTLQASGLLPEAYDMIDIDDVYTVYEPYNVTLEEIRVTKREDRQHKEVFSGFLVAATLSKTISGTTIVTTQNDSVYFGSTNFWDGILKNSMLKVTELEWGEFERDLHVATSDPVQARVILTPDFMHNLHDWWKEDKIAVRLAFSGNMLYMLFPYSYKTRLHTTSVEAADVEAYATEIIYPLWRTLRLLEDVK